VFFGMLGVTFFGLFLTPVFYVAIRTLTLWFGRRKTQPAQTAPSAGPAPMPAE
jgi:HAE1 family hydrophobic/amphiphilic exporter-1